MFDGDGEYRPPSDLAGYAQLEANIKAFELRAPEQAREIRRYLGRNDLYYLGRYISTLKGIKRRFHALDGSDRIETRNILDVPVAIEIARTVQYQHHRSLFVGGRGMLKSAFLVLDIIRLVICDSNERQLVLRSVKDLAYDHLHKIRQEVEMCPTYYDLWPEVFWKNAAERRSYPGKPSWSPQKGLTFKREFAALEASVQAAGAIDGLPIGFHFDRIHGDDIEEPRNVSTTELPKLQALNENVGPLKAGDHTRFRVIGTYHHPEGYHARMLPEAGWQVVELPSVDRNDIPAGSIQVEHGGTVRHVWWAEIGGRPRFELAHYLAEQYLDMGPRAYRTQYLCERPTDFARELDINQIKFLDPSTQLPDEVRLTGNRILLVDPGHNKNLKSDPSCFLVVALCKTGGRSRWIYLESGYYSALLRHSGRTKVAVALIEKYGIRHVRWEAYAGNEDHFDLIAALRQKNIQGVTVAPICYPGSKEDRTRLTLQPILEAGELYCPQRLLVNAYPAPNDTDIPRHPEVDLVEKLRQEIAVFPAKKGGGHILDCLSMLSERQKTNPPPKLPWDRVSTPTSPPFASYDPSTLPIF